MASTGSDIIPLAKCTCSFWCLHQHYITWNLHPSSVDTPADVHGRSHNFPLISPREVLPAGHWVTALPLLSCSIIIISLPLEVGLHGVGLVHLSHAWQMPTHKGTPTSDEKRSVSVEDAWPSRLVHHFIRGDICHDLTHHLTHILLPSILDLPHSLKGICLH